MGISIKAIKSIEELKADLDKVRTSIKEAMGLTDEEIDEIVSRQMEQKTSRGIDEKVALDSVVRSLRAQVRGEKLSPAATFDGYVIGDRGIFDRTMKLKNSAIEQYNLNKAQALKDGLVDMDQTGQLVVLDSRDMVFGKPNVRKGKPLLPEHTRQLYGVSVKRPNGQPKVFRLQVRDDVARNEVPALYKPLSWRANVGSDGSEMELRHSNRTRFRPCDAKTVPPIDDILGSPLLDGYAFKLSELSVAEQKCSADWNFFIVVAGDVLSVGTETDKGNIPITIWDESLTDETRTVWVPSHLAHLIDFGTGSRVVITGRVRKATFNNQDVFNINADGVYAIPEYKTEPGAVLEKSSSDEGN